MKKLTVMVSLYDSGEFIENRLDNLLKSTIIGDIDIWVVNADSPDPRDHTVPRRFNVNYVRLPSRVGVYAAWNHIIRNSNSSYLTNANADDLIAPRGYERLVRILDGTPKLGFVYPSWYTTDRPNMTWEDVKQGRADADNSGKPGQYSGSLDDGGVGHFPMWRRSLHNKFGLFDESFKALGDADWWARCYHVGDTKFHWHKEYLACYLWRNGQNLWTREVNESEWHLYHQKVINYQSNA